MSILRPRPPSSNDNEQTSLSKPSFEPSSSAQLPNASPFGRPSPTMFVIATILLAIFFIFRRTRRPSKDTRLRHDTMFNDQPFESAFAPETGTPEPYNKWDGYPSAHLPFQPPYYQFGFPPAAFQPEIPHSVAPFFAPTSTSSSSSSARPSAALPIPTIRRHSDPTGNADPEMTEVTRDGTTESEVIVTQESMAPGHQNMKLPRPWAPGRIDTVAMINGCRRHVMVLDGEPFRRGGAG